jgi:hypothetical protein
MNENFKILIADDIDYEDLFAEVYYNKEFVALLSQEEGFENLRISIYPPKGAEYWDFRFDEFETAINHAKKRLGEMPKLPEDE